MTIIKKQQPSIHNFRISAVECIAKNTFDHHYDLLLYIYIDCLKFMWITEIYLLFLLLVLYQ